MRLNFRAPALFLLLLVLTGLACNLPAAPAQAPRATQPGLLPGSGGANSGQPPLAATSTPAAPDLPPPTAAASQPFAGLVPAQPGVIPPFRNDLNPSRQPLDYLTQPGDTLPALARRFGVSTIELQGAQGLPAEDTLPPGVRLSIPAPDRRVLPGLALLPDSEVIYGPPAADFDIQAFVDQAGGYLARYSEAVDGEMMSGAQIVRRIALETSTNPRLLLAVLEMRAGWVAGEPRNPLPDYPIGFEAPSHRGLYKELALVTRQITTAYYAWREGRLGSLDFPHDVYFALDPRLNAGSVAIQNLFARLGSEPYWLEMIYGTEGFLAVHQRLFGDAWQRAAAYEPLIPGGLGASQPDWQLPFARGELWTFTGGPHIVWGFGSPLGAIDFAPTGQNKGCGPALRWATASAPGVVARSERGLLILDIAGDGYEHTGWTLLYLHLADAERLPAGAAAAQDAPLGHPSCEGGPATGRHVHIARRYNGEWIGVTPAFPFTLSGWLVEPGELPYQGRLLGPGGVVEARPDGSAPARITRD
ncbi:MAG: LysM peptidoglycan-binding domain-containing protein [Anaerolineae bacterium]|nr:LysM peptidoglycan-binding domain-containing protein [Anaerolineae bacterium]